MMTGCFYMVDFHQQFADSTCLQPGSSASLSLARSMWFSVNPVNFQEKQLLFSFENELWQRKCGKEPLKNQFYSVSMLFCWLSGNENTGTWVNEFSQWFKVCFTAARNICLLFLLCLGFFLLLFLSLYTSFCCCFRLKWIFAQQSFIQKDHHTVLCLGKYENKQRVLFSLNWKKQLCLAEDSCRNWTLESMLSDELESKPEVSKCELGVIPRNIYGQHLDKVQWVYSVCFLHIENSQSVFSGVF